MRRRQIFRLTVFSKKKKKKLITAVLSSQMTTTRIFYNILSHGYMSWVFILDFALKIIEYHIFYNF